MIEFTTIICATQLIQLFVYLWMAYGYIYKFTQIAQKIKRIISIQHHKRLQFTQPYSSFA